MPETSHPKPTCAHCGAPSTFDVPTQVNAQLNEADKAGVLDGTLFQYTCRACNQENTAYPSSFLYQDMDARWLVHMSTDGTEPFDGGPLPAEFADYQCRRVTNRSELVEKILIIDDQMDDRIIEVFKVLTWLKLPELTAPPLDVLLYRGIVDLSTGRKVGVDMGGDVAMVGYELIGLTEEFYPQPPAPTGTWLTVDSNTGTTLMKEGNAKQKAKEASGGGGSAPSYTAPKSDAKKGGSILGKIGCALGVVFLLSTCAGGGYLFYLEEGISYGEPTSNEISKKKVKEGKPFSFGFRWDGIGWASHDVWLVVGGDRKDGDYKINGNISCTRGGGEPRVESFTKSLEEYGVARVKKKGKKKFSAWFRIHDEYSKGSKRPWSCKGDFDTVTGKTRSARIVVTQRQRPSDFLAF